jgi:ATP-dependent Lon protease
MAVGRLLNMPDGSHSALVQGRRRVEIVEFIRSEAVYQSARARHQRTANWRQTNAGADALGVGSVRSLRAVGSFDPEEAHLFALNISEPGWLADMIATSLSLTYAKQAAFC